MQCHQSNAINNKQIIYKKIMSNILIKHRYSFIAGTFAACGSFFGKLPSHLAPHTAVLPETWTSNEQEFIKQFEYVLLHVMPFALMIVCNVLNWRYFLKALQYAEQTLTVTVLTAATNYMLSFMLGAFVYHEPVTLLTSIGASLIVAGMWYLSSAQESRKDQMKKRT